MQLPFEVTVALRYLRSRRKAGISLTSFLTVAAFAIGIAALTVVTAVWNGFEAEFLDKLLGVNAHGIVLKRFGIMRGHKQLVERLSAAPGITLVAPFVYSEVILQSARGSRGVVVKGIESGPMQKTPLARYIGDPAAARAALDGLAPAPLKLAADPTEPDGQVDPPKLPGALLGRGVIEALDVKPGDPITVISPYGSQGKARTGTFRVAGSFHSGMHEFDSRMIFIDLKAAQRFFQLHRSVTGLEVWTADPMNSKATLKAAAEQLDPKDPLTYQAKDWSVTNRGIFGMVRSQKGLIAIVLFIMVIVAAFMITATLILLILEKGREVALLKAIGATGRSILTVFVLDGLIIGVVGCLSGLTVGLSLCAVLQQYGLKLDPRVYYLEHLPIVVQPLELAAVCAGAMALSLLATLFPAWIAASMRPVDGLTQRDASAGAPPRALG